MEDRSTNADSPTPSAVASTALWMAADRARESARPDRLFDDALAPVLAGAEGVRLMESMEAGLPPNPALAIRTRYFDDQIHDLVAGGVRQVVLIAAGMDTRAFRLHLPSDTSIYELDEPELITLKEQRLSSHGQSPNCARHPISVDLRDSWDHPLLQAGFDADAAIVFLAEGLLGYLSAEDVHRLLATITSLAARSSVLLADVPGSIPPDAHYLDEWLERQAAAGISRDFTSDDPEGLFGSHGWLAHTVQYGEEEANYGRWPWPVPSRNDNSWPHNYLVTARRA